MPFQILTGQIIDLCLLEKSLCKKGESKNVPTLVHKPDRDL